MGRSECLLFFTSRFLSQMAFLNQSLHPTALDESLPNLLSPRSSLSDGVSSEGHSSDSTDASTNQCLEGAWKSVKSKGICVDFLFGNCRRFRNRCRFHHPTPEEVAQDTQICRAVEAVHDRDRNRRSDSDASAEVMTSLPKTPGTMPSKEHPKAPGQPARSTEAKSNQKLQNTVVMREGLELDPLDLLCQGAFNGTNVHVYDELPWLYNKAISGLHTCRIFVAHALRLRQSLPTEEHDNFDGMLYRLVRLGILKAVVADSSTNVSQLLRGRGVRSVNVLDEALQHGLLAPQHVDEIMSLLCDNLKNCCVAQQDLRLLLVGHLLGDVAHRFHRYCGHLLRVLPHLNVAEFHTDTQAVLDRLIQVSMIGPHLQTLILPTKQKTIPVDDRLVYSPYATL